MFTRSESFDGVREGCMAIDALSLPFYSSGHPAVQVVGNPADGGIKEGDAGFFGGQTCLRNCKNSGGKS